MRCEFTGVLSEIRDISGENIGMFSLYILRFIIEMVLYSSFSC